MMYRTNNDCTGVPMYFSFCAVCSYLFLKSNSLEDNNDVQNE